MAVTVSLAVRTLLPIDPAVEVDVHYLFDSGEVSPTPLRTLRLRMGLPNEITLHCRMALVIRVGSRSQLPLVVTHCDPDMSTALLLTELVLGEDAEPYTLSRRIVAPGGSQHLALEDADVLVIREIEEVGDA